MKFFSLKIGMLMALVSAQSTYASSISPNGASQEPKHQSVDSLVLKLTEAQRVELYEVLRGLNVEIKDWQAVGDVVEPTRCC